MPLDALHHAAIAHPDRWPEDRERDDASKPAAVLAFLALAPGMRVLDFQAGNGYFSELFSRVVGPTGLVYAHNHSSEGFIGEAVFERRYGDARLPNVDRIFALHNDLDLPEDGLDVVFMSMVYHDTYWYQEGVDWGPVDRPALLAGLLSALKTGGVALVIDHAAPAGQDPRESAHATHRIDPAVVVRDFTDAGFVLESESGALRNPGDDLERQIFEEGTYRATDRFMLLFRKQP